jgi:hypothetical protein
MRCLVNVISVDDMSLNKICIDEMCVDEMTFCVGYIIKHKGLVIFLIVCPCSYCSCVSLQAPLISSLVEFYLRLNRHGKESNED